MINTPPFWLQNRTFYNLIVPDFRVLIKARVTQLTPVHSRVPIGRNQQGLQFVRIMILKRNLIVNLMRSSAQPLARQGVTLLLSNQAVDLINVCRKKLNRIPYFFSCFTHFLSRFAVIARRILILQSDKVFHECF